jgi:hypothetical protein
MSTYARSHKGNLSKMCLPSYTNVFFVLMLCVYFFKTYLPGNLALCGAVSNLRTDKWRNCNANDYELEI